MTREDWFGLAVRLFGLWHLSTATHYLTNVIELRMFPNTSSPFNNDSGDSWYLYYCAAYATIGLCFIFGANSLTNLVYPQALKEDPTEAARDNRSDA